MDDAQRRTFLSQREVVEAGNPPVIGIRAEVQTVNGEVEDSPESEQIPLKTESQMVYVELEPAELGRLKAAGQCAINQFGVRLGPLVAARLGGTVKRWLDVQ